MHLADVHRDYANPPLREEDLLDDPLAQLQRWLVEAERAGALEPNAMSLATVGPAGAPASRMVLLRGLERGAAVFYTNLSSPKALDLMREPRCALLWWWPPSERQVRLEGRADRVTRAQAAAYFASRPRESQLAAWASPQSDALPDRATLEARLAEAAARFEGRRVRLPPHWGGFAVTPHRLEFWQGRPGRLHDRLVYRRDGEAWRVGRLAP
jgi:pyridoxamine 5'-phosphate oxidase